MRIEHHGEHWPDGQPTTVVHTGRQRAVQAAGGPKRLFVVSLHASTTSTSVSTTSIANWPTSASAWPSSRARWVPRTGTALAARSGLPTGGITPVAPRGRSARRRSETPPRPARDPAIPGPNPQGPQGEGARSAPRQRRRRTVGGCAPRSATACRSALRSTAAGPPAAGVGKSGGVPIAPAGDEVLEGAPQLGQALALLRDRLGAAGTPGPGSGQSRSANTGA